MNMRLSQEMDSLINMMHRAMRSAFSDRVILEIQKIIGTLSLGQRDTESGTSTNNQDHSEKTI